LAKRAVRTKLFTADSSEEKAEEIPYAELIDDDYVEVSDKDITNVTEESLAVRDIAIGNFILVKPVGKRSILHYIPEVVKDFHGHKYEIRYYKLLESTNKFILDKEN
jgi:hypothetical protein